MSPEEHRRRIKAFFPQLSVKDRSKVEEKVIHKKGDSKYHDNNNGKPMSH
jgi:hypothetical protein